MVMFTLLGEFHSVDDSHIKKIYDLKKYLTDRYKNTINYNNLKVSYNLDEKEEPKSLVDTKLFFSPFKVFI